MPIGKRANLAYSAGIPLNAGDRYYSQDLGRDLWFLLDAVGHIIQDLVINKTKIIISGGVVSQGAGNTLNITAGILYAPFNVTIPNTFASIPPATTTADIDLTRIILPTQTNLAIPNATADGATPNYVKVKYLEANGNSRNKAKKVGSYSYEVTPSYLITVDSVSPTAYEVCLGTFTLTGGGGFSFSTALRDYVLPLLSTDGTFANNSDSLYPSEKATLTQLATQKADLTKFSNLYMAQGAMINGKIVPSVGTNNLTVALKTMAGADATATTPIYIRIGDTIRTITSALSVTANAGTNWFNSGSAELATKEVDYFVYLGYNATDGVVLGISRVPYAGSYSDFSVTATNEKYAKISTISNATATDSYEVIGRFGATLGVSATYYWTVPTFNAQNLYQRPIRETRELFWTPQMTGWASTTGYNGRYKLIGNMINFSLDNGAGSNNSNATTVACSLPWNVLDGNGYGMAWGDCLDSGAWFKLACSSAGNGSKILNVFKSIIGGAWTNTGRKDVCVFGTYFI